MPTREAYEAILRALKAHPHRRVLECEFNDAVFGNFAISFETEGARRTVVNDRGELVLYTGRNDTNGGKTILPSLAEVDEQVLLRALGL